MSRKMLLRMMYRSVDRMNRAVIKNCSALVNREVAEQYRLRGLLATTPAPGTPWRQ